MSPLPAPSRHLSESRQEISLPVLTCGSTAARALGPATRFPLAEELTCLFSRCISPAHEHLSPLSSIHVTGLYYIVGSVAL